MKIISRSDDAAPNLSDSLFLKIFEKNKFEHIQVSFTCSKTNYTYLYDVL